jgi:serine/threonine-protein kinase
MDAAAGSAPTVAAHPSRTSPRLPAALVDDAARRFSILAVWTAGLTVFIQVGQLLLQPDLGPVLGDPVVRLSTLATVLMAAGIFTLHRQRLVLPSTIVLLGLVFETVVGFTISFIETSVPVEDRPLLGISTIGPWIVFVGAIIPSRPWWTLVAALAAATTWPIAYAINAARLELLSPPFNRLVVWPAINYLMALLAYLAARRWYGTAVEAQAAEELGSYRLVSPIGEGGMGEVWRATHLMLARAAAIKLVKPSMVSGSSARQADLFVKRFRREANAIAGLQSPHTVYLYDFGVSENGRLYYVMELLDGISLQTLVAHFGPQPAPRVVAILQQVCRSLEEAHAQGLVHRDLKPSNVMVCKVALTFDFVKVLDFGLAKSFARDDVSQLTMEGVATGTPGYIAPEVAVGESTIDGRADIYALGCVAYFLLTGTLVFPDPNPVSMALKHVQATPDPPSRRTEVPIPAELERLVLHCLEKKPASRPADAREVIDRLAACGVPPWTDQAAREWWDRHLPVTSSLRSFAQVGPRTPPVVRKR